MKINKEYIQETIELFLSQCGYFYEPNKANMKKIKDLFEALPFFFFDLHIQGVLYDLLKQHHYTTYINTNEDMKFYCYMLYKECSKTLNLSHKSYHVFYDDFKLRCFRETYHYKHYKKNNIHTLLFCIIIICCVLLYINMCSQET